jgi:hypothetical protein
MKILPSLSQKLIKGWEIPLIPKISKIINYSKNFQETYPKLKFSCNSATHLPFGLSERYYMGETYQKTQ